MDQDPERQVAGAEHVDDLEVLELDVEPELLDGPGAAPGALPGVGLALGARAGDLP